MMPTAGHQAGCVDAHAGVVTGHYQREDYQKGIVLVSRFLREWKALAVQNDGQQRALIEWSGNLGRRK